MSERIQILIVEDNPADVELLLRELRHANYDPQWQLVETEADFLDRLQPGLDLILSDFEMPEFSGMRALELLQEQGCDVPFIMVSGTVGEDRAVQAIKQGASDYLMKDRPARLGSAVSHTLEQSRLRRASKEAEKALVESEVKFRVLFDVAYDAIFITHQGIIVDCNARGVELFGLPREKIIGQLIFLTPPAVLSGGGDPKQKAREVFEAVESGVPQSFEWVMNRPDGTTVYSEINLSRFEQSGKIYVQAIARDITERKRAEEVLRSVASHKSGLQRRRVFVDLGVILALSVLVFVIGCLSHLSEEAFGYIQAQDTGVGTYLDETFVTLIFFCSAMFVFSYRRWRETRMEALSQAHLADAMRILHGEMEAKVRQRTGEIIRANQALEAEIADRIRADEESGKLVSLIEQSQDFIGLADLNGKVTFMNGGARAMIGLSPTQDVAQIHITDYLPEKWRLFHQNTVLPTILAEDKWEGEMQLRHLQTGALIDVSRTTFLIRDSAGRPKCLATVTRDVTKQKQAAEALQEREEQLGLYAEHSPVGIAMFDSEMRYLVASQRWKDDFHLAGQSIIGRSHYEILPDLPEKWKDVHRRCLAGAIETCEEEAFVHSDGQTDWLRWEVRPWRRADGVVGGIIIFSESIRERKLANQALVASERKFRLLAENITDVFWITSPDLSRIEYVSPACEVIRGCSADSLYANAHQWSENILPADRERVLGVFGELMRTHSTISVEYRITRADGTIRWVHDRGFQVRDSENRLMRLTGIATDITERKQAEQQIAEQAALLDKAQDAIVMADLESRIQFWNKGAERLYGWSSEEAVGKKITELIAAQPEIIHDVMAALHKDGEFSNEVEHFTKEGRKLTVEARRTLIRDDGGNPKSLLAIYTDITEKKKIEAQFMRAQRMESIGTLAGGMAHDLNNILAPIMLSIDLLKNLSGNDESIEILDSIESSAKRGSDVVRQVLSFARGLEGERIEVQPRHLLKELESIIRDTFPKDVRSKFSLHHDTWPIIGDPTQVHQILLNLCVNARDAMPNGGALTVDVRNVTIDDQYATMHFEAKPGRYVAIGVSDTGMGIPRENIDKIFEPFFTTKELNKGTGLGLSTVVGIVKSHNGFIDVRSELGKATTFTVFLPAAFAPVDRSLDRPQKLDLPFGKGETVLVVDDENSILTVTRRTLVANGYQVLTATDGADAVAKYAEHCDQIDVVLTDMMMPIMDGPAMIRALRRLNPAVKLVTATGLTDQGNGDMYSGLRLKHNLMKPYTADSLLTTIATVLAEA